MKPLTSDEIAAAHSGAAFPTWDPGAIASLLDGFGYLYDWRSDYRVQSVLSSLRSPQIMCFDAAILGYGLLDLFPGIWRRILAIHRVSPDGEECGHAVTVYRDPQTGKFGAFARSNFDGLEHREPSFASEREVALSYARAYVKIGFRPLYFGFADLDDLSGDLDWRRHPGDLSPLSERLSRSYQYELNLRDAPSLPTPAAEPQS
jgi:hypothetical protein